MTEVIKEKLPAEILLALELLHRGGHEAYVVGGCVRDAIMGNAEKDFDITTSALPKETCSIFSDYKIIETGLKHGTVTAVINHIPIEITTYRVDGEYSDNRRPDSVSFTRSLHEDVARRDFTMNAICYNPSEGFVDCFGGVEDIRSRIVRAVGDPDRRFNEDALRILRALRFSAVLGFGIEPVTAAAIHSNKDLLRHIAVERIAAELGKILLSDNVATIIAEYIDVFAVFMPELLPMRGFDQRNPHHCYDVLTHTLVATQSVEPTLPLRLTMLLHDIGKPSCFECVDGIGHFYGHANESVGLAQQILTRLKYDTYTKERVLLLIKHHDLPIDCKRSAVKRQLARLGEAALLELIEIKRADCTAQHPDFRSRLAELDTLRTLVLDVLDEEECFSLGQLAVDGQDLIAIGITQGKAVGVMLRSLLEAVIAEECPNERNALLERALAASDTID